LPFDNAEQMKDFFRDVLLADPILYHHLHLNAFSTKAPATTNALREFKKWIGKTGGSRAAGYIKKLIAMYKEGLEGFDINKMKWASDNLKAFGISMEEDEAPVPKKVVLRLPKKDGESFGSTVSEQVENILVTIYGSYPIERQKQAVRKALEILRYKENNIIQEARKPLQAKLVKALNDIKLNPKRPRYDIFGQSPASGKPMQKSGDFTELAKEIPSFEKSVVDIVEAEIKAEQKAQKMRFKKQQEEFRKQEEERDKKDKEYASKVDIQALREQYGTGKDKKYPSDKLFKKLVDNGITDALDYERNRGSLPHYKDFIAAFGNTFFSKLDEYIEDRR